MERKVIEIVRIEKSTEHGAEFVLAIPPQYMGLIIEAGMNSLIQLGAMTFITMSQEQYDAKPEDEKVQVSSEQEALWSGYFDKDGKIDPKKLN